MTPLALTGNQASLAAGTEDTNYTVSAADLLAGFTDVDGDTLSITGLTASNGSVTNNNNGTFTITPAANFNGNLTLNYFVSDGTTSTAASNTVVFAAVNDAPALTLISTTAFIEDAAGNAIGSVVATFSTGDEEGNSVTVTLSDTTNYSLTTGENTGQVLLTAAGLALVNAGTDLPAFTLTPNDGRSSMAPPFRLIHPSPPSMTRRR